MAPTLFLGLRVPSLTYVYDDPEHPDRPTGAIHAPDWTPEDRALVLGLEQHEAEVCACDWPIRMAWHADMEGWFDPEVFVCHACSATAGHEVTHTLRPSTKRDFQAKPLSDFDWQTTTTPPTPPAAD